MGTSPENTLTSFDLDLLLCSASSSLSETTDHGYQLQNVGTAESSDSYQVQNLGIHVSTDHSHLLQNHGISGSANNYHNQNMGTNQHYQHQMGHYGITDYGYQAQNLGNDLLNSSQTEEVVNKLDYEALRSNFRKLSADFESLQKDYQSKNTDYNSVKKQYAKLASDFSKLQKENSEHAIGSLNTSSKCENLEKKEVEYLATIKALTDRCEKYSIDIFAQSKQFMQYQSHVEDLMAQISTLKNNVQTEKNNGRDSRKMISTLTSNNETLKEHLCLFACIIEGRKQQDKESRRFIKKYCKKSTSSKKSVEAESFENHSVDTGRGSSLAYSDGERSFYSPSFNFSPISAGNVTPRNEQTKLTRDATTSPLPIAVTLDISTSPIIFEKAGIPLPTIETIEVATNTIICLEDKSSMAKVETRNIETSVAFDVNLEPKLQTLNIATSPIQFDDTSPVVKRRTFTIATSPVRFDDTRPVTKTRTLNTATSPILFDDTSPVTRTRSLNTATSPILFDVLSPVTKTRTLNSATSPILFDDSSPVTKTRTLNTATSPILFDDSSPVTKTRTLNTATSPILFDDSSPVTKTRTLNTATSPLLFDVLSPVTKTRTLNTATSPILFDDSSPVTKTRTLNTATSPILFDDSSPVTKTRTLNTATSPILFDVISPVTKTRTLTTATSPIIFNGTSPVSKSRIFNSATNPIRFDDSVTKRNPLTAISPITFDDSSPVANSKTLAFATSSVQCPPVESKSLHTEMNQITKNLRPLERRISESRNRKQIPDHVSKKSVTKINCHASQISDKLKEIVEQANSLVDTENDLEINMILSKHKMNWDLLSPLSLSPEAKQENKEQHYNGEDSQSLAQSLYLSEDEYSDNDRDREESHISDLPIVNPPQEPNSNNIFDLMKSQVRSEKADNVKCNSDKIYESQKETSNKNRAYTNVHSNKRKKLTNLQKIYKANTRKRLINIDDLPSVTRKDLYPKPQMSPTEYSVPSHNKEKGTKRSERSTAKLLHNKQDAIQVSKGNVTCSNNGPKQLHKEKGKVKSNSTTSQTNILPKTDTNTKVCMSTENQSNSASDCPQTNCLSDLEKPSSMTSTTQPQNPLIESASNKCIKTSVIQWNSACRLPHTQVEPVELVQKTLPKNESNKKLCPTKDIQTNDPIVSTHTRTHPQLVSGTRRCVIETQPQSQANDHTHRYLPETEIKKTDKQEFAKDPPECGTSIPELIDDVGYSYPKPTHKRVSRVKNDITTNLSSLNKIKISTNDRISNTRDNKLKRPADVINDGLDVKRKRDCVSQETPTKIDENMDKNMVSDEPLSVSIGESKDKQSEIGHADKSESTDTSDMLCVINSSSDQTRSHADYNDMALFTASKAHGPKKQNLSECWQNNVLDRMIYKYGAKPAPVKTPYSKNDEAVALQIKIGIDKCVKCISKPDEYTKISQQFITELQLLDKQKIVTGMMKYLNDPARKSDFLIGNVKFQKQLTTPTATKAEKALIDVIQSLDKSGIVPWDLILDSLEFILFNLERGATPGFDVVESVAHFYANICRYKKNVSRMWMFMLNAMYCLTFKAIPIIKHCLDVMPEVLPYSSTYLGPGLAPLIRCLVFLLNFYSCEDPFKRMDAIRRLLKYKYYYNLQDENETTLLFLLKESIVNLTDSKLEKDMLELSLLIVAKRKGTKWCHKNLVQKIILPMIKGDIEVSYRAKRFCVTTIGHLMKPYNNEMTVHTEEVVNMLINMFEQESQPHEMKEDIIRGLLNLNMVTLSVRINACLFKWNPPSVSSDLEEALKVYVSRKNIKSWHAVYKNYCREI